MPCYNVENYIVNALQSVRKQKYIDIELIIINDGSTDNTLEIINEEIASIPFETKIITQKNLGLSAARNVGIKESNGEYIYFFDSDDLMDENLISDCMEMMNREKLELLHFNCDLLFEKEVDELQITYFNNVEFINNHIYSTDEFCCKFLKQPRVPVWLFFYKRKFIENNKLYFKQNIFHEDELYTLQAILKAKKIGFLNNKYFIRRSRAGSITTSPQNKELRIQSMEYIIKVLRNMLSKDKFSKKQRDLINSRIFELLKTTSTMKNQSKNDLLKEIFFTNPFFYKFILRYYVNNLYNSLKKKKI
jgi:glycosyltransferase involved in cell wall biosynthesis